MLRKLITALALIWLSAPTLADTTLYLVRHAEKVADDSKDPALTEEGKLRANWLALYFADKDIAHVYSTPFERTVATALPTADLLGLDMEGYDPRALPELAAALKSATTPALIVGHSNTMPILAGILTGQAMEELDERIYDHIYIVHLKDDGSASLDMAYSDPRTLLGPVDHLKDALVERLSLMRDVAAYKWLNHLPVGAPEREAALVASTADAAASLGLDRDRAVRVLNGQMKAAKIVQQFYMQGWQSGRLPAPTAAPDLEGTIRPRIDQATQSMLSSLAAAQADLGRCAAQIKFRALPAEMKATPDGWQTASDAALDGKNCQ